MAIKAAARVCVEEKAPPCIKDRQTDINIAALFCFERRSTSRSRQAGHRQTWRIHFHAKRYKKVGGARRVRPWCAAGANDSLWASWKKLITYLSKQSVNTGQASHAKCQKFSRFLCASVAFERRGASNWELIIGCKLHLARLALIPIGGLSRSLVLQ